MKINNVNNNMNFKAQFKVNISEQCIDRLKIYEIVSLDSAAKHAQNLIDIVDFTKKVVKTLGTDEDIISFESNPDFPRRLFDITHKKNGKIVRERTLESIDRDDFFHRLTDFLKSLQFKFAEIGKSGGMDIEKEYKAAPRITSSFEPIEGSSNTVKEFLVDTERKEFIDMGEVKLEEIYNRIRKLNTTS